MAGIGDHFAPEYTKRKRRNRITAQQSRDRKKAELLHLKEQNEQKDIIIQNLLAEVGRLSQENCMLKAKVSELNSTSNQSQQFQTTPQNTNLSQFSMFQHSVNPKEEVLIDLLTDDEMKELLQYAGISEPPKQN